MMTDWQWKVILALCKLVVEILEDNQDIPITPPALFLVKEALERGKDANK